MSHLPSLLPFASRMFAFLVVFAAACDDSAPTSPAGLQPEIAAISPSTLRPSQSPQILTVFGERFTSGLRLLVTAPSGAGTSVEGTAIAAIQPTSFDAIVLLSESGTYTLRVETVSGGTSAPFSAAVQDGSTLPSVASISPSAVPIAAQPTTFTLNGENFAPGLTVTVTGPAGFSVVMSGAAIVRVSSTSLQVDMTASVAGTYSLVVTNPDGATSNAVVFSAT